jgi:glycosyltransferase involved in cell wall biosynthesis
MSVSTKPSCGGEPGRKRPYNVLYLQSTSEIGGADVALLRLVQGLDRTRFRPHVIMPAVGPMVGPLQELDCRVLIVAEMRKLTTRRGKLYLLAYVLNYPRAVWKLVRVMRGLRIDLLHTNTLHNLYGFVAARLAACPHVWHVREIVLQSRLARALQVFLAARFADRVVVISDAVGRMFRRGPGRLPACVRKIPDGVDVGHYRPENDGASVRQDLGLAADTPLVGVVSRLDHWKGVDTFLEAAALCRREFPAARYVVVGGPIEGREEYADHLLQLAEQLGLIDVVTFTRWRYRPEDMPRVHAALDLLVLPSRWPEPLGLVLLEAMASGKPVVATNHGGPLEICVDGKTGLLVPPGEPRPMADAILGLLRDPCRARALGAAGRTRVEQRFSTRHSIDALEALYQELVGG